MDVHTYSAAQSWNLRVRTKMWKMQQTMTYQVSLVFQLKAKLSYFFFSKANLNFKKVFGLVQHLVLCQREQVWLAFVMFLLSVTGVSVWILKVPGTLANSFFTTCAGFFYLTPVIFNQDIGLSIFSSSHAHLSRLPFRPPVAHSLQIFVLTTSRAHCRAHACMLRMVFRRAC